jgi:hypothetical protein
MRRARYESMLMLTSGAERKKREMRCCYLLLVTVALLAIAERSFWGGSVGGKMCSLLALVPYMNFLHYQIFSEMKHLAPPEVSYGLKDNN